MKRLSLDEMRSIAKKRGRQCLSDKYINNREELSWQCKKGHVWKANANNIKNGTWCPQCAANIRLNIKEMHSLAEKNNGKCLSTEYVNCKTKLKWQCSNEHIWLALPINVKRGSWCDICARLANANKLRGNIDELHEIAKERGGECLSETYINSQVSMRWRCREGHEWSNCANNVKRGNWCNVCSSKRAGLLRRSTIEEMHQLAKDRNGLCLSKGYVGNKQLLLWQCAEGHQWKASATSIKSSQSWCPKCGYESSANLRKKDAQIMHDIAKSRGGECLSEAYKNVNAKLRWRCANGHQWHATLSKVLRGSWCSVCSSYLGERICREYLEQIFGFLFPKARPKWLFNSDGNRAELDGYCPELGIAFEHHGQYHYQVDNLYSRTKNQLEKRQKEDQYKEKLCLENRVKVIVIPEIFSLTPIESIIDVIRGECDKKEIKLPPNFDRSMIIDLKRAYSSNYAHIAIQELKAIAQEHGGKCLSVRYERSSTKMKWLCRKGHIFKTTANSIKRGSWCRKCCGLERLSIEEMKLIAEKQGGKCLSEEYKNARTKLKWQCAEGHIWEAIPNSVKHRGTWCGRCASKSNYKNLFKTRQNKINSSNALIMMIQKI